MTIEEKSNAASEETRRQLEMQKILIGIAGRYINIPLEMVNEAIDQSLREIGEFIPADRVYVFEYNLDKNTAKNTFEWCSAGTAPQIEYLQQLSLDNVPHWLAAHKEGEVFEIDDVSALPDDGPGGVRAILEPQGIKSLITVPMGRAGDFFGCVGFDTVRARYTFTDREKNLLRLFSNMLLNIQLRKRDDVEKRAYLHQIQQQNEKMREYTFNISHRLRLHTSNLEGLLELMSSENPFLREQPAFDMMRKTSRALDDCLREGNTVINS